MPPRLKVCCIASLAEARLALEHGASALGLVGAMPSGPGVIADELIAEIAAQVPPEVATFLLTSQTRAEDVVEHVRRCGTNTVQLVDRVENGVYGALRRALPNMRIVQVIHVRERASIDEALSLSQAVDALLLDSGNAALAIKELGGTGRVHDWELSREIVERAACPVFLAGGLTPGNVRAALERVRPFGIDLCSGVRSDGALDARKLAELTTAMWR